MRRRIHLCLHIALTVAAVTKLSVAQASSRDDTQWSSEFSAPAFDGPVLALASFEGDLIAGGMFRQTPDGIASGVARWDGAHWHAMGSGLVQVENFEVFQGKLVAAAYLGRAESTPLWGGAIWDGLRWNPLGAPGRVQDLAVLGDELVACGYFVWTDSSTLAARWDGQTWRPLGTRVATDASRQTSSCATYQGHLYVGGDFRMPGDSTTTVLLRWTGTEFESLALGQNRSRVLALATYADRLYIGGEFKRLIGPASPPLPSSPLLVWDGNNISAVGPSSTTGIVQSLFATNDGLLVGGRSGAFEDGTARVSVVSPTSIQDLPGLTGDVYAVCIHDGRIVAGGSFSDSDNDTSSAGRSINCAAWTGALWNAVAGPPTSGSGMFALDQPVVMSLLVDDDTLFASGRFSLARNKTQWTSVSNVARWDGTSWAPIGAHGLRGWIWALTRFRGQLIAGGDFQSVDDPDVVRNIARWDGSAWRALGPGIDGQVMTLAVMNDQLIVGGSLVRAGSVDVRGVARWNGESWDSMGPIQLSGLVPVVRTLLVSDGKLLVGGAFSQLGGIEARNVTTWDGHVWAPLGSGIDQEVNQLAIYERDVIAAGSFTRIDGVPTYGIARWDGRVWVPFPGEVAARHSVQIFAVHAAGEDLFVGGVFDEIAGVPASNIARWDGVRWNAMGSGIGTRELGLSPIVCSIKPFRNSLYVGGTFSLAGGGLSSHVARWDGLGPVLVKTTTLAIAPGRPNPFSSEVLVPFWLPSAAHVDAQVVDLAGRCVRTVLRADLPAGYHPALWDGTDAYGRRVRAGLYFVKVRSTSGESGSRSVLLLR